MTPCTNKSKIQLLNFSESSADHSPRNIRNNFDFPNSLGDNPVKSPANRLLVSREELQHLAEADPPAGRQPADGPDQLLDSRPLIKSKPSETSGQTRNGQ